MRTLALLSLLVLTAACEDRQVEVREATAQAPGAEQAAEAHRPAEPTDSASAEHGEAGEADESGESGEAAEARADLEVEVLERGSGPAVHRRSTVRVHYEAWLAEAHGADEAPFDSSLSRLLPLELQLGGAGPGVIEGLSRGLLGLHEGSRALLRIPARLGWGAEGNPAAGVAPDSDLVYEVRVVSVL